MRRIGRYLLQDKLGEGGMGIVWKAQDRDGGRPVAVKVLHRHRAQDPVLRARFSREAEIGQMIDHPGVMRVFEHGEVRLPEGTTSLFMAMEFAPGRNLQVRTAFSPLTVREIVGVGRQVSAALAALHARGIVHRDLKPGNLMVSHDGVVKLLDLGLAKPLQVDAERWPNASALVSQSGVALGTVPYSAPEQLLGAPAAPAADLFSLGVILYQQLGSRVPFSGTNTAEFLSAISRAPVSVRELRPEVGPRLEQLVIRLIDKTPQGRPGTAEEVRAELEAIDAAFGDDLTDALPVGDAVARVASSAPRRRWWQWRI